VIKIGTVGVIGANGFVGTSLIKHMESIYPTVALGRFCPQDLPSSIQWRQLDLFSAQSAFDALKGIDVAVYLVHSMMPSSHLFQGNFHDTDLLLADNFVRACAANKVRKIIYLSGLMPDGYVSPHLQSRREVEEVFQSSSIPVTVLRAGMIVGSGGSSFEILKTLVQRLPFMLLPVWTLKTTQAVFIDDIVEVLLAAIADQEFAGLTLDIVNGERLNYERLLRQMARVLGVKRLMIPIPIQSTRFSKLWVRLFGNSTKELVSPLIDSLLCDLPQVRPSAMISKHIRFQTFEEMARESIRRNDGKKRTNSKQKVSHEKSVRSIQRLVGLPMHNAQWIVEEYMNWLPKFLPYLLRVERLSDKKTIQFYISLLPWPVLVLRYVHGEFEDDRQKFHIVGGLLTKTTDTGWLEFRQVINKKYTLSAIHEFVPALPWPIYRVTQALIHKITMSAFDRHLKKKSSLELVA
jgi:uncharacterized protein YbjT (DUF2867 family)